MSASNDRAARAVPACALILLSAGAIRQVDPSSVFWTAPLILVAAMLIAWAAESAQFFIAQGFALAILAWLQTLPEFAVEAVLAWKQQVPLLMANLTGALRLLTGLGWPMIYATAAIFHRSRWKSPLRRITLAEEHCVEVVGLLAAMAYLAVVWWKASLHLIDAGILIAVYIAYLVVLRRMPKAESEQSSLQGRRSRQPTRKEQCVDQRKDQCADDQVRQHAGLPAAQHHAEPSCHSDADPDRRRHDVFERRHGRNGDKASENGSPWTYALHGPHLQQSSTM